MTAGGEHATADRGITPEAAGISARLPFENKIIVVTGASKLEPLGIGAATALEFARQGAAAVIITGTNRPDTQGPDVRDAIEATGGTRALWLPGDISDPVTIVELISQVKTAFGQIDVLTNNAGTLRDRKLKDMSLDDWDTVIDTNLRPAFLATQELVRQKAYGKDGEGSIVNIASIVGIYGNEGQGNYSPAKGGMISLTRTQAKELASINYRANAVAPGLIDTEMTHESLVEREAAKKAAEKLTPVGRIGEPQDVANVVVFLASSAASFINGQVIEVDGGLGGKVGAVTAVAEGLMRLDMAKGATDKQKTRVAELEQQLADSQGAQQ